MEFYDTQSGAEHPFASVQSSAVPRKGEYINIRKETWHVGRVTWALDQSEGSPAILRANVELVRAR